jgi:type IV pilus assembly protein PilC
VATNVVRQKPKGSFDFSAIQEQIEYNLTSLTVKDMAIFARQFAAMFNAGVAIVRCLSVLHEQCSNAKLKRALRSFLMFLTNYLSVWWRREKSVVC